MYKSDFNLILIFQKSYINLGCVSFQISNEQTIFEYLKGR